MVSIASQFRTQKIERDDEQLLDLFRNRTALKQEFEKLRRENDLLKNRLSQQEGDVLQARQQLEQLEGMLSEPAQAANAEVYYQLRGVWLQGRKKVQRMSAELLEKYRKREAKLQLERFNAERKASLKSVKQDMRQVTSKLQKVKQEIGALEEAMASARWFWNKQKRNELRARLEVLAGSERLLQANLEKCQAEKEQLLTEEEPGCAELSMESRREINLILIALAQELYLHFHGHEIASRARQATVQQLAEVNYGDLNVCRALTQSIDEKSQSLLSTRELYTVARDRAAQLKSLLVYRREQDTVPVAGSLSEIAVQTAGKQGSAKSHSVNVLVDEYWDLYSVLVQ